MKTGKRSIFFVGLLTLSLFTGCSGGHDNVTGVGGGSGGSSGVSADSKTTGKTVLADAGSTTKAKIFMGADDNFTVNNSGASVYGSTGTVTVAIASGATGVILDQNVKQVNFPGTSSSYTFKQTGNMINVYDSSGTTLIAKVPVTEGATGTVLSFSDGKASALMGVVMSLGGATVGSTAAAITPQLTTSTSMSANLLTKAKVFLDTNSDVFTVSNSGASIYGGSGNDSVTIATGATGLTLDQNVEQVNFTSASSSYTYKQSGNIINVYDPAGTTLVVKIPVLEGVTGTLMSFTDGTASALMTTNGMTMGGKTVSSTAATMLSMAFNVSITLSGTVATGSPLTGAIVTVTDKTGAVVATSDAIPADGSYSLKLTSASNPPFILKASLGDIAYYSVALEAKDATVNISHITDLIVARLSAKGSAAALLASEITAVRLTGVVNEVKTMLAPVFEAANVTTDPLNGVFKADGTGLDRVLDSLSVKITPTGTYSNIEVGVKGQDAPVQFRSDAASLTPLPATAASALPVNGTGALITDLLTRMTACYAVPSASRVDNVSAASPVLTSSTCTSLFLNDDPTQYKNNGNGAGKGKDFNGMFSGSTVVFGNGSYEFTRSNGDMAIGYRWVDSLGNAQYESAVVRNVTGALKLVGNQYQYSGGVVPYAQYREFLNRSGYNYYSVGYNCNVANTQLNGVPLFDHVDVITPYNTTIVLKPIAGVSYLGITNGTSISSSTFIRLRSEWAGTAPTGVNAPRDFDTTLIFAPVDIAEDALISAQSQSTWTFKYYLASAPTVLAQTQTYRTKNRTMSISEFKESALSQLASLTSSTTAALISASSASKYAATPATGGISVSWSVPSGSLLPPTQIKAWGAYGSSHKSWDDSTSVGSASRTGAISCTTQSTADTHCSSGNYATGDTYNSLHLWARSYEAREFAHLYALY